MHQLLLLLLTSSFFICVISYYPSEMSLLTSSCLQTDSGMSLGVFYQNILYTGETFEITSNNKSVLIHNKDCDFDTLPNFGVYINGYIHIFVTSSFETNLIVLDTSFEIVANKTLRYTNAWLERVFSFGNQIFVQLHPTGTYNTTLLYTYIDPYPFLNIYDVKYVPLNNTDTYALSFPFNQQPIFLLDNGRYAMICNILGRCSSTKSIRDKQYEFWGMSATQIEDFVIICVRYNACYKLDSIYSPYLTKLTGTGSYINNNRQLHKLEDKRIISIEYKSNLVNLYELSNLDDQIYKVITHSKPFFLFKTMTGLSNSVARKDELK